MTIRSIAVMRATGIGGISRCPRRSRARLHRHRFLSHRRRRLTGLTARPLCRPPCGHRRLRSLRRRPSPSQRTPRHRSTSRRPSRMSRRLPRICRRCRQGRRHRRRSRAKVRPSLRRDRAVPIARSLPPRRRRHYRPWRLQSRRGWRQLQAARPRRHRAPRSPRWPPARMARRRPSTRRCGPCGRPSPSRPHRVAHTASRRLSLGARMIRPRLASILSQCRLLFTKRRLPRRNGRRRLHRRMLLHGRSRRAIGAVGP